MRQAIRLPAFRRLLVVYTLSVLAWAIGFVVLALLVYERTGSAVGSMVYFLCSAFVPALVSPAIVARLGRRAPKNSLAGLYGLEAAIFVALWWLAGHFSLVPLLALTMADGILALTARSIARATTVDVLTPHDLLRSGNAVTNTTSQVSFMVGPAIGGVVSGAVGASGPLLLIAALFAVMALAITTADKLTALSEEKPTTRVDLRAAARYARTQPVIRSLLSLQAIGWVFFTISIPIEVILIQHTLHAGGSSYGLFVSAWGGGAVVGSAVYALGRDVASKWLMALGAGALGVGFGVMALAPSVAVVIAGGVLAGVGNGVELVAARTALQEHTDQDWMTLIMSFNESLGMAIPGAGILLGGIITAISSPRVALGVASVGALAITGMIMWRFRPSGKLALEPIGAATQSLEPTTEEPRAIAVTTG